MLDADGFTLFLISLIIHNGIALIPTITATFHAKDIVTTNDKSRETKSESEVRLHLTRKYNAKWGRGTTSV